MMNGRQRMQAKLMHTMRGITLIELMIVVVIIGFMAVIAYPNYREFAARAKRNEAKAALLQIATNQERFYLQNNTYAAALADLILLDVMMPRMSGFEVCRRLRKRYSPIDLPILILTAKNRNTSCIR